MPYMLLVIEPPRQRRTRTEDEGRELYARMLRFGEELKAQRLLRASESLESHAGAARVTVRDGRAQVLDGPFAETKELVAGYTLIQACSREEALEWSRRFPAPHGEFAAGEIEVRQRYELEDFEPDVPIERFREIGIGKPARAS